MPFIAPLIAGAAAAAPAIAAGRQIVGGLSGKNQANQAGAAGQAAVSQAPEAIYQPKYMGQVDPALAALLGGPQAGAGDIGIAAQSARDLLRQSQNPELGGMLAEAARTSLSSRGLGSSPLGGVLESAQVIPQLAQIQSSATNQLASIGQQQAMLEAQRAQQMQGYLGQGIAAGGGKGQLLGSLGTSNIELSKQLGANAGTVLNQGMGFDWTKAFGQPSPYQGSQYPYSGGNYNPPGNQGYNKPWWTQ